MVLVLIRCQAVAMNYGTDWFLLDQMGRATHEQRILLAQHLHHAAGARPERRAGYRLLRLIAALVGLAALAGLVARGSGVEQMAISPRGEVYAVAGDGVYRFNPVHLVAEGIGWDLVTLLGILPLFLSSIHRPPSGTARDTLVIVGLLGYFAYQYLMYAVTWAFGPLFLLWVAIYTLSLLALARELARSGITQWRPGPDRARVLRVAAIYALAMSGILTLMWLGRIVPASLGTAGGILQGQHTMTVQALDLGIIVPLGFAAAWVMYSGHRWALLLGAPFLIVASAMSAAIVAMLFASWARGGAFSPVPVVLFTASLAVALWTVRRLLPR